MAWQLGAHSEPRACVDTLGVTEGGEELVPLNREPGSGVRAFGMTVVRIDIHGGSVCQRLVTFAEGCGQCRSGRDCMIGHWPISSAGRNPVDAQHLEPAGLALLGAFQQERRQPGVPVPGRVPVVAQPDQLGLGADEAALALVGDHQPGITEDPRPLPAPSRRRSPPVIQ